MKFVGKVIVAFFIVTFLIGMFLEFVGVSFFTFCGRHCIHWVEKFHLFGY